jgi:hypothetical protein
VALCGSEGDKRQERVGHSAAVNLPHRCVAKMDGYAQNTKECIGGTRCTQSSNNSV